MPYVDDDYEGRGRDCGSRGLSAGQKLLIVGAIGLFVAPYITKLARRRVAAKEFATTDARVDTSLENTFPASDPPAQHFTDIPINRQ